MTQVEILQEAARQASRLAQDFDALPEGDAHHAVDAVKLAEEFIEAAKAAREQLQ